MPRNEHSDQRYEAARKDVLYAVGPVEPNPFGGPDNPDPFGHNQSPWPVEMIACRITEHHGLRHDINRPGQVLKMNRLRELLAEMAAEGSIVGRPRKEWAAVGRESPSRSSDILYAHPLLVAEWFDVPRET